MIAKSIYLLHFLVASLFVTGNGQGFFGPSNPFEHNIAPNPGHGGYQGYYGGGDTSAGLPFGRLFQQHQQRQQSFNQLHHQAQAQGYGHSQGFGPLSPQLPNFFGGRSPFAGNPFAPSAPPSPVAAASSSSCSAAVPPKIDYGDCPTLEAKEEDKMKKEEKQKECLKDLEVSENSTVEALGQPLQDKVRECVLRKEELVNEAGKYNYDKALEKLKEKGLPEKIDKKVAEAHVECKIQAERKYLSLNQVLSEVGSYQDCMDYHLIMLCNIKEVSPVAASTNHFHGLQQLPSQSPTNYGHLASGSHFGDTMNKLNILSRVLRR